MEKSLELLYADNKKLIADVESRIQKLKEDIDNIKKISDESIELVFPDNWELRARLMSRVTFNIQNKIVIFYTQPVGISIGYDSLDSFLDIVDGFPKGIEDRANSVNGKCLQLLIDYFIKLLEKFHNDLGLLQETKFSNSF